LLLNHLLLSSNDFIGASTELWRLQSRAFGSKFTNYRRSAIINVDKRDFSGRIETNFKFIKFTLFFWR